MQPGTTHEFLITNWGTSAARRAVFLPVHPCPTACCVVNHLVQVRGDRHPPRPNCRRSTHIDRPCKHVHITVAAHYVFASVLLDTAPRARIVRLILRHHIGQREALGHLLVVVHVRGGRHVATRIP